MQPTQIRVIPHNLPDLLDQLASAPRDAPVLLNLTATPFPTFLWHFVVSGLSSSSSSSSSSTADSEELQIERDIVETAQLIGKICEMLFAHSAGCVACIERPPTSTCDVTQQQQHASPNTTAAAPSAAAGTSATTTAATPVAHYCSGPALAFACACAHRCVARGVHFWFGDTCACGIPPYGGLTHTLREWLGAGLAVPVLVGGALVTATPDLAARTMNCTVAAPDAGGGAAPSWTALQRVLTGGGGSNATAAWLRACDPAARLAMSYSAVFNGVAWLRARRALRVQSSVVAQSQGRRGRPEAAALELLIRRSVRPAAFQRGVLAEEHRALRSFLSNKNNQKNNGDDASWNPPLHVSVFRGFFRDAAVAASVAVPRVMNSVAATYDGASADELSLFLQRTFRQRGLPVQVFSIRQALTALTYETHAPAFQASSSEPLCQILLWDTPVFVDSALDASSESKARTELRTRMFLPEVCMLTEPAAPKTNPYQNHAATATSSGGSGSGMGLTDEATLRRLVIDCLRKASPRMLPAAVQRPSGGARAARSRMLSKFVGLQLLAALVRQAMLCVEDGAFPIGVRQALRGFGCFPTVFDRVDRDGDTKLVLELLSALAAVAPYSVSGAASAGAAAGAGGDVAGSSCFAPGRAAAAAIHGTASSCSAETSCPHQQQHGIRRTGTKLLTAMLAERDVRRFAHFLCDSTGARLDDHPLRVMILAQTQRPNNRRRIVSHDEVVMRMVMVAAAFVFQQQHQLAVRDADRLAGAVLGFPAFLGGTPLRHCVFRHKTSLNRVAAKKQALVAVLSQQHPKKKNGGAPDGDEKQTQKQQQQQQQQQVSAAQFKKLDEQTFAARLVSWATALGPNTMDAMPEPLIAMLRCFDTTTGSASPCSSKL